MFREPRADATGAMAPENSQPATFPPIDPQEFSDATDSPNAPLPSAPSPDGLPVDDAANTASRGHGQAATGGADPAGGGNRNCPGLAGQAAVAGRGEIEPDFR